MQAQAQAVQASQPRRTARPCRGCAARAGAVYETPRAMRFAGGCACARHVTLRWCALHLLLPPRERVAFTWEAPPLPWSCSDEPLAGVPPVFFVHRRLSRVSAPAQSPEHTPSGRAATMSTTLFNPVAMFITFREARGDILCLWHPRVVPWGPGWLPSLCAPPKPQSHARCSPHARRWRRVSSSPWRYPTCARASRCTLSRKVRETRHTLSLHNPRARKLP